MSDSHDPDDNRPTGTAQMQFNPDCLSVSDWVIVDDIADYPLSPFGERWLPETPVLIKLVIWASWGFIAQQYAELMEAEPPSSPDQAR